jgi:hypothetical protein
VTVIPVGRPICLRFVHPKPTASGSLRTLIQAGELGSHRIQCRCDRGRTVRIKDIPVIFRMLNGAIMHLHSASFVLKHGRVLHIIKTVPWYRSSLGKSVQY